MIATQNLAVAYPGKKQDTLQNISFSVEEGEIFGFLGPSGAGKSTLQKVLTGVLRGYRGGAQVLGCEVGKSSKDFYEQIGVDFEFPNFYGKFTALENLDYFSSLYAKKPLDPLPLLERVGLLTDKDKRVDSYSKGMKMRLGFVRCLLHDPAVLFLDEPTSGLDPANARILKQMMREEQARGKTIILTTHNMHDAAELCTRVAFIVEGQIRAMDTPHALCREQSETEVRYCYRAGGKAEEAELALPLAELPYSRAFLDALQKGEITSIQTRRQTLEDVFVLLTGRCLQ